MRNAFAPFAVVLSLSGLAGCASKGPVQPPVPATRAQVEAEKWFSVDKYDPWYAGCRIRVTPEKGQQTALKVGMHVAWVLANDCDASTDLKLTFYRNGNPQQPETPIDFQPVVNGVLKGTVQAPTGLTEAGVRYKYTAQSGDHRKDPEIIIFP